MKINLGKALIGAVAAIFLAPVVYSVIMAFVPENDKSVLTDAPKVSALSGEQLYSKCAPCHGDNGDGTEAYPPLNTLTKEKLMELIAGYQAGSFGGGNNKKIMQVQVEGISREDAAKLAEYVTKLKPRQKSEKELQELKKNKKEQQIDITGISS
ncbi:MAG: cytochrome c [Campylobacterales bacterium]